MYIVEIIDPRSAELYYNPRVLSTQQEAEEYLQNVCEGRNDLEGIIVSVLLEKNVNNRMILTSADVVYHT